MRISGREPLSPSEQQFKGFPEVVVPRVSFEVRVGVGRPGWGGGTGEREQEVPSPNYMKANGVPRNGERSGGLPHWYLGHGRHLINSDSEIRPKRSIW